jgi:hypothetical protein
LFSDVNLDRVMCEIKEKCSEENTKPTIKEDLDRLKGVFRGRKKKKKSRKD